MFPQCSTPGRAHDCQPPEGPYPRKGQQDEESTPPCWRNSSSLRPPGGGGLYTQRGLLNRKPPLRRARQGGEPQSEATSLVGAISCEMPLSPHKCVGNPSLRLLQSPEAAPPIPLSWDSAALRPESSTGPGGQGAPACYRMLRALKISNLRVPGRFPRQPLAPLPHRRQHLLGHVMQNDASGMMQNEASGTHTL